MIWGIIAAFLSIVLLCLKFKYTEIRYAEAYETHLMRRDLIMFRIWFIGLALVFLLLIIGWCCTLVNIKKKNYSVQSIIGIVACALTLLLFVISLTKLPDRIKDYNEINKEYTYKIHKDDWVDALLEK